MLVDRRGKRFHQVGVMLCALRLVDQDDCVAGRRSENSKERTHFQQAFLVCTRNECIELVANAVKE